MARRTTWLIDMGDGTWSVCCMACRIALYRGGKAGADARRPRPLLRTRPPPRPAPPAAGLTSSPVGGAIPDPPWTDAPPTPTPTEPRSPPLPPSPARGDR